MCKQPFLTPNTLNPMVFNTVKKRLSIQQRCLHTPSQLTKAGPPNELPSPFHDTGCDTIQPLTLDPSPGLEKGQKQEAYITTCSLYVFSLFLFFLLAASLQSSPNGQSQSDDTMS